MKQTKITHTFDRRNETTVEDMKRANSKGIKVPIAIVCLSCKKTITQMNLYSSCESPEVMTSGRWKSRIAV